MTLNDLNARIRDCRRCRLWEGALNAVPGEGPEDAEVMLIGLAPGSTEDAAGRPFLGRAGRYLDGVLAAHGIERGSLFITSIVKHRTPGNRYPAADEIEACHGWLAEQIARVEPRLILLMGLPAWRIPRVQGIEYLETYHPAAAMRFPDARERFERDIARLAARMKNLPA